MKQVIKSYFNRISENVAGRVIKKSTENASLADNIAYRVVLETMLNATSATKKPNDLFYGVSDNFWFWLNTEGVRRNPVLRSILPGVPDEFTQLRFTGGKGDSTLAEAFEYYQIFREQFRKYRADIFPAGNILDFGCGWGRIIRFFIKDIDPSNIWGCDPVTEMIDLCKQQNKWCNFQAIDTAPPTPFQDNMFDMIYSFSVFSHLSEDWHLKLLPEIKRILKPGGIYITTTRNRQFIEACALWRNRSDIDRKNPGPSSSQAFPETEKSLADFDKGLYCHHSYKDDSWPFWGETAIPKKYVMDHWTKHLDFLDFIEVSSQNVIIVQKPA